MPNAKVLMMKTDKRVVMGLMLRVRRGITIIEVELLAKRRGSTTLPP